MTTVIEAMRWRKKNPGLRGTDHNGRTIIGIAIIPINCEDDLRERLIQRSTEANPDDDGLLHNKSIEADLYFVLQPDNDWEKPLLSKQEVPEQTNE